jgi:hypothetical protein
MRLVGFFQLSTSPFLLCSLAAQLSVLFKKSLLLFFPVLEKAKRSGN